MFLDKSAANELTMDWKYGWAPVSVPAIQTQPLKHTEKWSILPLYTQDGFIAWDIHQGSYTAEFFNEFLINYVVPIANIEPSPRSVLVMDNAKIHWNEVYIPLF